MTPPSASRRTRAALALAGLGVLLLTGLFFAGSREPRLALRAVARESVEVMDAAGRPLELVTLVVDSQERGPVRFVQLAFVAETRVAGNWVEADPVSNWGGAVWDGRWDALILVPEDADACRIRFQYALRPLWVQCLNGLAPRGGWLDARYPAFNQKLWRWAASQQPQLRWREIPLETKLP